MGDFLLGEEINFSWAGGSLDPIPENRAVNETFVLARHGKQFRLRCVRNIDLKPGTGLGKLNWKRH
jgi:hypothetical protein